MRYYIIIALALALSTAIIGCEGPKEEVPPIKIVLGPTLCKGNVVEDYALLAAILSEEMDKPVEFIATSTPEELGDLIKGGEAFYCYADPITFSEVADYSIILAKPIYAGIGSAKIGAIITQEDKAKEVASVSTMKGQTMMIVDNLSIDGYLSQKFWLAGEELDIDYDFDLSDAGGDPEKVIEAVKNGDVVYGCVPYAMAPQEPGKGYMLIKTTPKAPVEVFGFYEEGDNVEATKLKGALKGIPKGDPALEPFGIEKFTLATQAEYDQILMFLAEDKLRKAEREVDIDEDTE